MVDFKRVKIKRIKKPTVSSSKQLEVAKDDRKTALDLARNFQVKSLSEKAEFAEKVVIEHTKKHFFERLSNLKGVRNLVVVWLFLVVGLLFAVSLAQTFGQRSYKQEVFVDGGTFSEGIVGEIKNLNPLFASTAPEKAFAKLGFLRLFSFDESGRLKGELAEKTISSDNYKTVTIKMRKAAKWSDGRDLTSDDVIFTIDLMKNPLVNPQAQSWRKVKAEKLGDFELKFEMPAQTSAVLHGLNFPILPKHALEGVAADKLREDKFSGAPITSGSFSFKSLHKTPTRSTIKLEANQNYIFGRPKLDRFEVIAFNEKEQLKEALNSGEILAAADLEMGDFTPADQIKFKQNRTPINRGIYAFLNTNDNILKNQKVRQAVQLAVDMSIVRKEIDSAKPLDLPVLVDLIGGAQPKVAEFDQKKAISLLESEGWKLGANNIRQKDGQNLRLSIFTTNENSLEKTAESFTRQLRQIGFEVEMTAVDKDDRSGSFVQSILQPRSYGILIYEIDLGADSDIYPFWHSSQATANGLNFSNYRDSISDDILVSLRQTEDEKSRQAKFEHFNRRWINNVPAVGVSQATRKYVYRKSVQTYDQSNMFVETTDRYNDVIYWRVSRGDIYKTP